ncbi:hypothetical protein SprV_0100150900 [Sparganum proliferum]
MQRGMDLFAACEKFGLNINSEKTVVMQQPPHNIAHNAPKIGVNGTQMQVVDNFSYLGSTLSRTPQSTMKWPAGFPRPVQPMVVFMFSDGCRVCKCERTSVLCKKGPCRFFARLDEDALDYCDGVLSRNAIAYKDFTRKAKAEKQKQQAAQGPKIDATSLKFNIQYDTKPRSKTEEQAINHEMIGVLQNQVEDALQQSMDQAAKRRLSERRPGVTAEDSVPAGRGDPVDASDFRRMFGRLSRLPSRHPQSTDAMGAQPPNLGSGGMGADVIRPPGSAESSPQSGVRTAVGLQKRVPAQQIEPQLERTLTAEGLGRESILPLESSLPRRAIQTPAHVQTAPKTVMTALGEKETAKGHAVPPAPHMISEKDLLPQAAPPLPPQVGIKGLTSGAVVPLPTKVVNRDHKPLKAPALVPPQPLPQRPAVIEGPKMQQPTLSLHPQVFSKTGLPASARTGSANLNVAAVPIPPPPPPARRPVVPLTKDRIPTPLVAPKGVSQADKIQPSKESLDLSTLIDRLSIKNNPPKQEVYNIQNTGRLSAPIPQMPPAPPAPAPLMEAKLPSQLKPDTVLEDYFLRQPAFEDWPPLRQPSQHIRFVGTLRDNEESPMLEEDVVRQSVSHVKPTNLDRLQWQPFNEYVQEPKAHVMPAFHALPESVPCDRHQHGSIPESELSAAYEKSMPEGFLPTERHSETWPDWPAVHLSQHRQHPHLYRPGPEPLGTLEQVNPFSSINSFIQNQQKQGGHLHGDNIGKMSEKVKNLLDLTKAAIELLVKANYTEAKLLQNFTQVVSLNTTTNGTAAIISTTKMDSNSTDRGRTVEAHNYAADRGTALRQQVKQLTAIITKLQELVPQVEEYAREEEEEEKNNDSVGEVNKLISATSLQTESSPTGVILMSPLGAAVGTAREKDDREHLLVKLEHCEAYSAKLLKALEEKKMLDSLGGVSSSATSKEYLLSLLSALKPLL